MKKILVILIFIISGFFSSLVLSSETNYYDCILENLKNTSSDIAAKAVIDVCKFRHKAEEKLRHTIEAVYLPVCIETKGQITNDIIFLLDINEPFTGSNYCEYPNGSVKSKGDILSGKKNNKWIWWYSNEGIGLEKNYKNGKTHGVQELYLEGRISIRSYWTDGEVDSDPEFYDKDGNLIIDDWNSLFPEPIQEIPKKVQE